MELVKNSGLLLSALIEVGNDHRLADQDPLAAMLRACEDSLPSNYTDILKAEHTMNQEPQKATFAKTSRWKWLLIIGALILSIFGYIYFAQPWGPGPNGPWSAADQNRDGTVTREEMELFGKQKPHRNLDRLLKHFDAADTNHDGVVIQDEIDVYGTAIGSKDPYNHRNER